MMKDATNRIPVIMIGSYQNSREILEDSDVPIFPVVLITLKDFWYSAPLWDHITNIMCGG